MMSAEHVFQEIPAEQTTSGDTDTHTPSRRFRFKSKSSKRHSADDRCDHHRAHSPAHHKRHHRHHHGNKRRRLSASTGAQAAFPHDGPSSNLNPDAAFRESLFDAMGDDEGAAYWESVYGQPIHTYSDEKRNEETGELEKMNEEEYIAYVRRGMWERSWEGREARKEERRKEKLKEEMEQKYARRERKDRTAGHSQTTSNPFDIEIEESLRRGQERKEKKMWHDKWKAYVEAWDHLYQLAKSTNAGTDGTDQKRVHLRDQIVWPVESGRRKDVGLPEIERFMVKSAGSRIMTIEDNRPELDQLLSNLKVERVRWHPDKMQHRFGSFDIDEETLKGVTEVFQVMDHLYNQRK